MLLADFHIHSKFSDGQMAIPEIVDLYGERGFGAIAITDHVCEANTIIGRASKMLDLSLKPQNFNKYLETIREEAERAWTLYKMIVLPGFELSKNSIRNSRSAHIIGLGISDFMWADQPVEALCASIREQGGVTIAAHPVHTQVSEKQTFYLWDRRESLRSCFDAWEVASGAVLFKEVLASRLPMIANSDMHRREQMTSWKTVIHSERHPEAILEAIRKQRLGIQFYKYQ